jgi:hypothetical protein
MESQDDANVKELLERAMQIQQTQFRTLRNNMAMLLCLTQNDAKDNLRTLHHVIEGQEMEFLVPYSSYIAQQLELSEVINNDIRRAMGDMVEKHRRNEEVAEKLKNL